jgi:serine/threonine protein kinase
MSYCLNPDCQVPENPANGACQSCGTELTLRDRYQSLKPIGQGGFGRTFLAVDLSQPLKPRCAIKQLYPRQQGVGLQEKASEQFRQEAQQLAVLGHYPSMPRFLNYFEQDGYQYLVQEFIEGQNLAEVAAEGRIFTEAEVRELLEKVLETIDFLHHRQIIHRDIKPANIIQTPNGRFVLVDLGAAKVLTGTALGQTGTVIGSAEYVAPEQLRGKAVFASDLYSLGATCVTMLTGMSPFSLFDTSTGAWEWRDYLAGPVGDRLGKILDRMLLGPTKQRYASAQEVLRDLVGERSAVGEKLSIGDRQREVLVESKEKDSGEQTNLEIDRTQTGEIVGDSDRSRPIRRSLMLLGGLLMLPIGLLIFAARTASRNPVVSAPFEPSPVPTQSDPTKPSGPTPKISPDELIKPTYTRVVKPFKTFNNIPPFSMMALQGNGSKIATGLLEGTNSGDPNNLKVNLLDVETTQASALNFPVKGSFTKLGSFMYLKQDNLFIQENNQEGSKQVNIFNLKNNSLVSLPGFFTGSPIEIINGESLLFQYGDKEFIWKIASNGEVVKTSWPTTVLLRYYSDRPARVGSAIMGKNTKLFSADSKHIFTWDMPGANGKVEVINLDKGPSGGRFPLEGSLSFPQDIGLNSENISLPRQVNSVEANGNVFFVTGTGSDDSVAVSGADFVKQNIYLPEPHKNDRQSLEYTGPDKKKSTGFAHQGTIAAWDVKQQKFLYYIPRRYPVRAIKLSPDGRTMATIETDMFVPNSSKISIWDLPTGRLFREIYIPKLIPTTIINKGSTLEAIFIGATLEFTSDSKTLVLGVHNARSDGKLQEKNDADISLWNVEELRNP